MQAIQTQPDMIGTPLFPAAFVGSACPTCGQVTVCASCNRCHYCEDVDLPCFRSQRAQAYQPLTLPHLHSFSVGDDHHFPLAFAGSRGDLPLVPPSPVAGFLEAEENESNPSEQPSPPVDPDIPTNFDDLSDEQLAELIRNLIAQAACIYRQEGGAL